MITQSIPENIQLSKNCEDLSHQIRWSTECLTTLSSLKGCRRSAAAAAQGSISMEADGECPCPVVSNALGSCQFVVDTIIMKILMKDVPLVLKKGINFS